MKKETGDDVENNLLTNIEELLIYLIHLFIGMKRVHLSNLH